MNRRSFLSKSVGAAAAAVTLSTRRLKARAAPNDRITIAAIGVRGRGGGVLQTFAPRRNVEVNKNTFIGRRRFAVIPPPHSHVPSDLQPGQTELVFRTRVGGRPYA